MPTGLRWLFALSRSRGIARRYFVVNGFDGALTLLGLNLGFYVSGETPLVVVISACLGATVALGISGVTSAYISESAERERELQELEGAMVRDLSDTAHGQASRAIPVFIALVNGLAPFSIGMLVILPLWLAQAGVTLPLGPLELAIITALSALFFLGIIIGRIRGSNWLWSGVRTLLIALLTAVVIFLLNP
ncbi:MAG TPA: VIT1/CCC1 transporter family protein [Gammaproteobacteria bacterium]